MLGVLAVTLVGCGTCDEDLDGDGVLAPVCGGRDCDDGDSDRRPGADDTVGDGVDQGCDGIDGVDADGDGVASLDSAGADCDDDAADAFPGAPDTAGDARDQDCDGADGVDADRDGFASVESGGDDCDDADAERSPAITDTVGDGLDQDCDGADGDDEDGDTRASLASGGDDCDDADADTFPGAADDVGDGVDQSCDGVDGVDADGDGWASDASGGEDCDDAADTVNPDRPDGLPDWEVVTPVPRVMWAEVRVGADGEPAIAFTNGYPQWYVSYAERAAGAWTTVPVAMDDNPGWTVGLALDSSGDAHVAYGVIDTAGVSYATDASGAWAPEPVDVGSEVAIAVGPDDVPRIAWSHWTGTGSVLKVGTWNGAGFDEEVVPGVDPTYPRIVVDASGAVHVCSGMSATSYTTNATGAWSSVEVAATLGYTSTCAIALDAEEDVHIAHAASERDLIHATNDSGTWTSRTHAGTSGWGPSIGVDDLGTVSFVFAGASGGVFDLWYAADTGGGLEALGLAPAGVEIYAPSAWIDRDGVAHVVFHDLAAGELLYGVVAPRNGVDDDCDGAIW